MKTDNGNAIRVTKLNSQQDATHTFSFPLPKTHISPSQSATQHDCIIVYYTQKKHKETVGFFVVVLHPIIIQSKIRMGTDL